ncbi:MAG: hypothetical protein J6P61_06850 [Erysipelotrichaceae bacterium]|nr:hypothetical protein [Erysipelotrichaceae bacterium]
MLKKIMISLLALVLIASGCARKNKETETNHLVRLFDSYDQKETSKGKFQFKADDQSVYIKRKGDYIATPFNNGYDVFANDEIAYYMDSELLMRYDFANGESTQMAVMPVSKDYQDMPDYFKISAAVEDMFYITRNSMSEFCYTTYSYNLLTGVTNEEFNGGILDVKDDYAIVNVGYATDVSATKHAIYQLSFSGAKHIKNLGKYCKGVEIVGEKIYFCSYKTRDSMSQCTLYRCSLEGKNKEKVATFKVKDPYGIVVAFDYTEDACTVMKNDQTYHYTYETASYEKVEE